jgi:hypothetical protein
VNRHPKFPPRSARWGVPRSEAGAHLDAGRAVVFGVTACGAESFAQDFALARVPGGWRVYELTHSLGAATYDLAPEPRGCAVADAVRALLRHAGVPARGARP